MAAFWDGPEAAQENHRCFEIVDDETSAVAKVHGDPDMPEEAKQALMGIARAAYRKLVRGGEADHG
jgi:hypothetical protein